VSGLGGTPYRDGSYEYYMSEKVITNDRKGVGAFLQAANEMELLPTLSMGKGKTVMLDDYFNSEKRKTSWAYSNPIITNGMSNTITGSHFWEIFFINMGSKPPHSAKRLTEKI